MHISQSVGIGRIRMKKKPQHKIKMQKRFKALLFYNANLYRYRAGANNGENKQNAAN